MNTGLSCKYLLTPPSDIITTIIVQVIVLGALIYVTERRLSDLFDAHGGWREVDPPS